MNAEKAAIRKVAFHPDRGVFLGAAGGKAMWAKEWPDAKAVRVVPTFADPPHDFQDYLRNRAAVGACDGFTVEFREVHPHGDGFTATEDDCADALLPRWS